MYQQGIIPLVLMKEKALVSLVIVSFRFGVSSAAGTDKSFVFVFTCDLLSPIAGKL